MNDETTQNDGAAAEIPEKQQFDAWVVRSEESAELAVGTLPLDKRWLEAFAFEKATGEILEKDAVGETLASAAIPTVLASGSWTIEQYAVEAVIEATVDCKPEEVWLPSAPGLPAAPLLCLGTKAAQLLAQNSSLDLSAGMEQAVAWLEEQDSIVVRPLILEASYWGRVTTAAEAKEATWGLLKRLQFRPGGFIAKYVNRPVSIRMSQHLIETRVTPNQTTWVAAVLGAIGVAMIWLGGYWWAVAGTLLMQFNSILDGIDGELARIRYQTSEFGAYLDSVCDEILNAAIVMAAGAYIVAHQGFDWWWFWVGVFGGTMTLVYGLVHWHCKWKHGLGFYWWWEAYKPRKQVQRSTSLWAYFKKLFWKESVLFIYVLAALFGFMQVLVFASGVMGFISLVLFFIHIVIKRARW